MELQEHNIADKPRMRVSGLDENQAKVRPLMNQAEFVADLIEIKKAKQITQHIQSKLFLRIGLFIGLLFITTLFEWRSYDDNTTIELAASMDAFDELLDIPPTEQPPPPPPKKIVQPNIVEVQEAEEIKEEINIDLDMEITEETVIAPIEITVAEAPEEEVADEVFTIVEVQPTPKMGLKGFYTYIYENIKYPKKALTLGVEGKVYVQFIVNADGKLSDFNVVKGIGMGCDEEALKVLKTAEAWNPGKQRGKPVRVRMILPIHFVRKEI